MFNYEYILAVSFGGILGALLRWGVGLLTFPLFGNPFLGTLLVNLLGCFIAGLCIAFSSESDYSEILKLFIFIGFLGSFTTFSSFSIEMISLLKDSKLGLAFIMISANVFGSLCMTVLGMNLIEWLRK